MTTRKTHFQQIPVDLVKKLAQKFPATENDVSNIAIHPVKNETHTDVSVPAEPWRDVAEKVQREQDPKKMIELVDQLIAKLDEERSPAGRCASSPSLREVAPAQ